MASYITDHFGIDWVLETSEVKSESEFPISLQEESESTFQLELLQTARECQQNYYEICADWNRYEKNEHCYLKSFIGYALYGPPGLTNDEKEKKTVDNDKTDKDQTDKKKTDKDQTDKEKTEEDKTDKDFRDDYDVKQKEFISLIYNKVIEYGKCEESDGIILCGIIYNVIFNKEQAVKAAQKKDSESKDGSDVTEKNSNDDGESTYSEDEKNLVADTKPEPQVYPVPVFKVRQFVNEEMSNANGSTDGSSIDEKMDKIYYIDNVGRVYDGFTDYLEHNQLPECTMVLPKDGKYQMDPADKSHLTQSNLAMTLGFEYTSTDGSCSNDNYVVTNVWIEIHESPASNIAKKILTGGDIASTVVSVASMGVAIAAVMTPVGAGFVLAGAVGAGVSGLWHAGRCAQQLADRGQHGESINVTDKAALGAWIGIAGSSIGLAHAGGGVLLARAIRTGTTVGRAATIAYDAVIIGNLVINGVGLGFKSFDMYSTYKDGGDITAQDIFFLTTHVLFFCNAVVNIRLTKSFIETSQGQLLKDYEASLRSNRHRKEFQRMARNTRAAGTSDISSNEEIIRCISKIDNTDEFFQAMVRNRKAFSASGARAAFSSDGKIIVNSIMTIDPIEFANLPKNIRVDIVKGVSSVQSNNTAANLKPTTNVNNETSYRHFTANNKVILKEFCIKHSTAMLQKAPPKIADFANVLKDLRNVQNEAQIFLKLLEIGYKILQAMPRDELIKLGDVLSDIVQFLWDYVKMNMRNFRPGMMLEDPSANIVLERLLQELWLRVESKIDDWVRAFKAWLKNNLRQGINEPFMNEPHYHS